MDPHQANTATAVRITAVSERPRLLSVENPYGGTIPTAPLSSRSSSPVSELELVSESCPSSASLSHSNPRYLPIRAHSSPVVPSASGVPLLTTYVPRPSLVRARTPSLASSPTSTDSSSFSPLQSHPPDSWPLPSISYSYSATCYHDDSSMRSSSSMGRPLLSPDSRSVSQASAYTVSSTSSDRKSGGKEKSSRKRRRGFSSGERMEITRCGRHGDEWLTDGWGSWFKKIWRE